MVIYMQCESDHIRIENMDTKELLAEARTVDDYNTWADSVIEEPLVYCSSSMDFPEEYTEDEVIIDICRQIRRAG